MAKKISQDQSPKARAARLAKGICPIHGLSFGQIDDRWGQCSWNRRNENACQVRAEPSSLEEIAETGINVWRLAPEFLYLLDGE